MIGLRKRISVRTGAIIGLVIGIFGLLLDLRKVNPPLGPEVLLSYFIQVLTPALVIAVIVWVLGKLGKNRT